MFKPKDLMGMPWRVALALQADGWYLRQDIIWAKPNPMPESVTDRCTKSHEYIFLLAKSPKYYFDAAAIKEPVTQSTVARLAQNVDAQHGSDRVPGKTNGPMKAVRSKRDSFKRDNSKRSAVIPGQTAGTHRPDRDESAWDVDTRNKRSVWTVATQPYSEAHFATFPPALIEPCVLAGSPAGGTVLDPFGGSGTTGEVAEHLGRNSILIELNPTYAQLADRRTQQGGISFPAEATS
jgi:DNA modification methylase